MPKTTSHIRLALDLLKAGEIFESKLAGYMRPMLIKGVPSLITELRSLYKDEGKTKMIENQLTSMMESMEKDMVLSPEDD